MKKKTTKKRPRLKNKPGTLGIRMAPAHTQLLNRLSTAIGLSKTDTVIRGLQELEENTKRLAKRRRA